MKILQMLLHFQNDNQLILLHNFLRLSHGPPKETSHAPPPARYVSHFGNTFLWKNAKFRCHMQIYGAVNPEDHEECGYSTILERGALGKPTVACFILVLPI
jgi:hypothetical protein